MKLWTFGEVIQKVKSDLDLQEEIFITPDEMVGYVNEAIHEAESEILKINEDYFLTSVPVTLTVGQSIIPLPTNIYAQKIRGLIYSLGSVQYPVKRIRGASKFDILVMIQQYGPNDDYMYFPVNNTPGTQNQLLIAPNSRDNGPVLTLWFIRSANTVPTAADEGIKPTDPNNATQLGTILDIPEFTSFIIDFVKCKCMGKDTDPRFDAQVAAMEKQRSMMVQSLTEQTPDDDNQIPPDMSFYRLMS